MRNCLVIVDMQNGFINEHTEHLINIIEKFIKDKGTEFTDIVGTRYINHKNTACYIFEGWKECMKGTEEADIVEQLKPYISRVFDKDKYSCWNKEFRDYVEINEFDKLYFIGVNTGCCVLHSILDAYNDLQDSCIISDLCGSTKGKESHENSLSILREIITEQRVIESTNI